MKITFSDPIKLSHQIRDDDLEFDPHMFWEDWEVQVSEVLFFDPTVNDCQGRLKGLFLCARNICSIGSQYQDAAR